MPAKTGTVKTARDGKKSKEAHTKDGKSKSPREGKAKWRTPFGGISLTVSNPLTYVDLLDSPEINILLEVLTGLSIFINAYPIYLHDLLKKDILSKVKNLLLHKNQDVVKYNLDLLTSLSEFDEVCKSMLDEDDCIITVFNFLKTSKVSEIIEHSINCLSKWSSSRQICKLVGAQCDLKLLFNQLKSDDPDITAYTLVTLFNLAQDVTIAEMLVNEPNFEYSVLINLIDSEYPAIQHRAIRLIDWFTSYEHCDTLKHMFIEADGVEKMIKAIETHYWPDIHPKALKVLTNVGALTETYERLREEGVQRLLFYLIEVESRTLEEAALEAVISLLKIYQSRQMFTNAGIVEILFNSFNNGTKKMVYYAILGFGILTQDGVALSQIEESPDLINQLMVIVGNKKEYWVMRNTAACCVQLLLRNSLVFSRTFIEYELWDILVDYLSNIPKNIPIELATSCAACLNNILEGDNVDKIINIKMLDAILDSFSDCRVANDDLKEMAAEILETIVNFESVTGLIKTKNYYRKIIYFIFDTKQRKKIFSSLTKVFSTLIESDPDFMNELIDAGVVKWLFDNFPPDDKESQEFIRMLFKKCKFVKFHYTCRLEVDEYITSGFFTYRGQLPAMMNFQILPKLLHEWAVPRRPIYFVNFEPPSMPSHTYEEEESSQGDCMFDVDEEDSDKASVRFMKAVLPFPVSTSASAAVSDDFEVLFPEMKDDPKLRWLLRRAKRLFGYKENEIVEMDLSIILDKNEYVEKLVKLSLFVCDVLSGAGDELFCKNHCFELHLNEIKWELGTSIIPLGYLKMGMRFERALLFKTIGDQVGIPSTLVKGDCAAGWIEVYILPEPEPLPLPAYPNLMAPNHIIDLDTCPGTFRNILSQEAEEYRKYQVTAIENLRHVALPHKTLD